MFTKNFKKVSAVLLLSSLGVAGLISCGNENKEYTVDFKIQDASNAWAIYKTETTVNGKVEAPEAPVKQYYTFGGWYETEAFEKTFETTGIKKDSEAYGKYIPEEVTVHINDDKPVTKNLVDVVNATYNPGEGLDFDGWYEDAAYTLKWDGHKTVTDLYAKSAAILTFNNGYEDVYTEIVKPGIVYTNPAEKEVAGVEEGTTTTLEAKEIVKDYMSLRDIHYVNEAGEPFDFKAPITKSQTITVNWNTKDLYKSVRKDEFTQEYTLIPSSNPVDTAPVWSMQSTFTIDVEKGEGETATTTQEEVKVEAFYPYADAWLPTKAKKIIIGEGVKSIAGMNAGEAAVLEEVSLPKSLRIIDNCFSNFPTLKGITLPEGLELITGSFFKNTVRLDYYKSFDYGTKYDFDIEIPASVKGLAMVPTNLTFAEGSEFAKEDGRIVLNRGEEKILVSDTDNFGKPTIVVPEGITAIQNGTYYTKFDTLMLPSTFKKINYLADRVDYPYYASMSGSDSSVSASFMYDSTKMGDEKHPVVPGAMHPAAYSITTSLGGFNLMGMKAGMGLVKFAGNTVPAELNKYAFCGDTSGWALLTGAVSPMDTAQLNDSVILEDNVAKLYVTIRTENENPFLGFVNYSTVMDTKAIANITELVDAIKLANPDNVEAIDTAIQGKTLELLSNNEVITVDKISGEMFLTIVIK